MGKVVQMRHSLGITEVVMAEIRRIAARDSIDPLGVTRKALKFYLSVARMKDTDPETQVIVRHAGTDHVITDF